MALPSEPDNNQPPAGPRAASRRRPAARAWQAGFAATAAFVGLTGAAKRRYRQILAAEPDNCVALSGLGRLLSRQRRFGEAAALWERVAALRPEADFPAYQLARTLYRSAQIEAAAAAYLRLLSLMPEHQRGFAGLEQAIERLGRVRAGRGEAEPPARAAIWRDAEAVFRRRLLQEPGNERVRTNLARVLSSAGKSAEALPLWAELAEAQPGAIEPKLQIARIKQNERHPDAEAALRAVLALNPRHGETLRRLVRLLDRAGAPTDYALQLWYEVAALDHRSTFPPVQRGLVLEKVRREADAEAAYRDALAAGPADPLALLSLARFFIRHARWAEARDLFERLHRAAPKRADALLGLGRCHERLGDLEAAEAAYRRALDLEAGNVGALLQFGRLLRRVGRVEEAIAARREAAALAPANGDAWHELIYLLASAEREDEALAELDRAAAGLGASAEARVQLGRIAEAARFPDRAEAYFADAIAAAPEDAGPRARLGEYYLRQGIVDGAFHHLLDSRELDPGNVAMARHVVETVHLVRMLGIDQVALRRGPRTTGAVLVPERLFALVRDIADRDVRPYEPVARRIIAVSASLAPGGAERQLVTLLRGLSAPEFGLDLGLLCVALGPAMRRDFFLPLLQETPVAVAAPEPGGGEAYLRDPAAAPFADLVRRFPEEMIAPAAFWLAEFRRRRPAIVHAWQDSTNLTAVVAALLAGVPRIVLSTRSVRPDNPRRRLKRFMQAGYRAVLGHPAVVLCNNSRAGAADYADWLGIDPATIEVAYNGIDFAALARQADAGETRRARAALAIPPEAPVLGSVFRMSEEKRPLLWVDTAAAVARRLPAAHFVVCGEGPMRDDMRARAAALGIGDRFHLPGSQANIAPWYRMMDLVMLTSRHEGLPNVLLEAQCLGVPVVAPDAGGMSETVWQGVTGWTLRDADAAALAERVVWCLGDAGWRDGARAAAPGFVRDRFGVPAMLHRHLEIYGVGASGPATGNGSARAGRRPPAAMLRSARPAGR